LLHANERLEAPQKNSNKKKVMNKKPLKSGLYPQTGLGGFYSRKKIQKKTICK